MKLFLIVRAGGRWPDMGPYDGTLYCRVCNNLGTSQFQIQ